MSETVNTNQTKQFLDQGGLDALWAKICSTIDEQVPLTYGSANPSAVLKDADNDATARYAFAGGTDADAGGYASIAYGEGVITRNNGEAAFGKYNKSNKYETLLSVGNGYEENRSNALEVAGEYTIIQYNHEGEVEDNTSYTINSAIEISPENINLSLNKEIIYDYEGSVNIDSNIHIDADSLEIKHSNKIELYTNNSLSSDSDAYNLDDDGSNGAGSNIVIDNLNGIRLSHENDRFNDQYSLIQSVFLQEKNYKVLNELLDKCFEENSGINPALAEQEAEFSNVIRPALDTFVDSVNKLNDKYEHKALSMLDKDDRQKVEAILDEQIVNDPIVEREPKPSVE